MIKYYIIIIFTAFLSSVSQILLNVSTRKPHSNKFFEYFNPYVITSYSILFAVLAINIFCMKYIPLKNANAVAAMTYVFTLFLSKLVLNEKITIKKILGDILIIVGIIVFVQ